MLVSSSGSLSTSLKIGAILKSFPLSESLLLGQTGWPDSPRLLLLPLQCLGTPRTFCFYSMRESFCCLGLWVYVCACACMYFEVCVSLCILYISLACSPSSVQACDFQRLLVSSATLRDCFTGLFTQACYFPCLLLQLATLKDSFLGFLIQDLFPRGSHAGKHW